MEKNKKSKTLSKWQSGILNFFAFLFIVLSILSVFIDDNQFGISNNASIVFPVLATAFITYLAFYEQYKANLTAVEIQNSIIYNSTIQELENKLDELNKIHEAFRQDVIEVVKTQPTIIKGVKTTSRSADLALKKLNHTLLKLKKLQDQYYEKDMNPVVPLEDFMLRSLHIFQQYLEDVEKLEKWLDDYIKLDETQNENVYLNAHFICFTIVNKTNKLIKAEDIDLKENLR